LLSAVLVEAYRILAPVTIPDGYAALFRQAYAALHGGLPGEPAPDSGRRPGEPIEEYLARSRGEALNRLRGRFGSAQPPDELRAAHELVAQLLASAVEADAALAAQVEAYRCGQFDASIQHSDRLNALVAESARLDRDLLLALRSAEDASPGTLESLGIEGLGPGH
jgi:hypothetical protein